MPYKLHIANGKKKDVLEGGRPYLNTLEMRLFVANIAVSGTVQPASPSDECVDTGYAPLANPFPTAAVDSGTQAKAVGINPTFVFDHSPGTFQVFGVFYTDPTDGDATVMAQLAEAPFTVTAAGQVFVVEGDFLFDDIPE